MDARQYLMQARGMRARIDALRERRQRYADLATRRTAHYRPDPGGGTNRVSSVEEYACKMADLDRDLARRIGMYAQLILDVERAIDRLEDQRHRDVLTYRYLNGWSWGRIARKMQYSDRAVFQFHREALARFRVPD